MAIGLLGAVTVAAALGERRRRQAVEAFRAAQGSPEGVSSPQGGDAEDGWEHDVGDDETIATIDSDAPDKPLNPPDGDEVD